MRVGIISRTDREKALDISREISEILKEKHEIYFDEILNKYFPDNNYSKKTGDIDLLISVGGDGTILKSVRRYRGYTNIGGKCWNSWILNEISPEKLVLYLLY